MPSDLLAESMELAKTPPIELDAQPQELVAALALTRGRLDRLSELMTTAQLQRGRARANMEMTKAELEKAWDTAATSPRPGPRLLRQAAVAENAVTISEPLIIISRPRLTKLIT